MAYMRASVAYLMANGDTASNTTDVRATLRPPNLRPATYMRTSNATLHKPDNARVTWSAEPNRRIHPCSRR